MQYAIRIPANRSLELKIEDILFRPPGRPGRKPLVRCFRSGIECRQGPASSDRTSDGVRLQQARQSAEAKRLVRLQLSVHLWRRLGLPPLVADELTAAVSEDGRSDMLHRIWALPLPSG